jgi:uncharacterized membrane protein
MTRHYQPAITCFAVTLIGLGALALTYGDFALVWQPVPDWVPGRTALAYASGVIMLACGVGLLFTKTAVLAIRILFPYLVIWMLLKVPALAMTPLNESVWLGVGELILPVSAGWVLFDTLTGRDKGLRPAQLLFALALIPIGLSHMVYQKATVDLVPAWLPFRGGWAYLTGVAHMAAGLGVLFSVVPRLAATLEAAMIGIFTLLVWVPAIAAAPSARLPWTAFFISGFIGAAAWIVADSIPPRRRAPRSSQTTRRTVP